ncbi:hypothetical protein [Cysteiniphilum sp. 6C5]|uniref:hypothetical protein n=1 Tax=unclassified Cysteiniphilum TaxID=2610889 RepID=UPI003F85A080
MNKCCKGFFKTLGTFLGGIGLFLTGISAFYFGQDAIEKMSKQIQLLNQQSQDIANIVRKSKNIDQENNEILILVKEMLIEISANATVQKITMNFEETKQYLKNAYTHNNNRGIQLFLPSNRLDLIAHELVNAKDKQQQYEILKDELRVEFNDKR